jgi:acetyltransferase-like isoleucine patch superfamily enzyme
MTESRNKSKKHSGFITGSILLSIIVFIIFSLGFFPIVFGGKLLLHFLAFDKLWHFLFLPFIIYIGVVVLIISELSISGLIIKLFNIKYKPGTYEYSFNNKNTFKWIIICSLYTPCRKIIEIFPVGTMKNIYYKLLGMKIGENTLVGGVIKDPCVTEFGDNVTMGEYAIIYGHIQDYSKGIITINRIKIGNNCVIGAGAIIMPGATLQDDVVLAAGALVKQNQVLEKGKTYAGVPAKEININNKNGAKVRNRKI